ncbi:14332_t:CDS:2, partial [Racocetra fulgida]
MNRANNFRQKQYKKQNIKSNVQIESNDQEFEVQRLSTYYNKENTNSVYASDIKSDDSNHEANTSNLEYFTAELYKNYDHSSNDEEIAKTNDEEKVETNDEEEAETNDEEETKNNNNKKAKNHKNISQQTFK